MYQYPPTLAGLSGGNVPSTAQQPVPPEKAQPQNHATAPSGAQASSAAEQLSEATSTATIDPNFIHREVSAARKAQAQMISSVPKPPPLGWKLAMDRLAGTVQSMEKLLTSGQALPPQSATSKALSSIDAMKQADRLSNFYAQASGTASAITSLSPPIAQAQSRSSHSVLVPDRTQNGENRAFGNEAAAAQISREKAAQLKASEMARKAYFEALDRPPEPAEAPKPDSFVSVGKTGA